MTGIHSERWRAEITSVSTLAYIKRIFPE